MAAKEPRPPLPFDQGKYIKAKRPYLREYRKLPPGNVFEVLIGPTGPRLWDNIREGLKAPPRVGPPKAEG